MKKLVSIVLAGILIMSAASFIFAEEQGGMMQGMKCKQGMMGPGKMMCPMCNMMMKSMGERSMVATEDGGVIVMAGNKLFKYDRNLQLKKEADIKIDATGMQQMMMQAKEGCPMCKMMMQGKEETEAPVREPMQEPVK